MPARPCNRAPSCVVFVLTVLTLTACSDGSAPSHTLDVEIVTTGLTLDPDGYTLTIEGAESFELYGNRPYSLSIGRSGRLAYTLSGVADNCSVASSREGIVEVPSAGAGWLALEVSCTLRTGPTADRIVFTRTNWGVQAPYNWDLYLINTDGTGLRRFTEAETAETGGSFSPDGTTLLYEGPGGIWQQPVAGGPANQIPTRIRSRPRYAPDGLSLIGGSPVLLTGPDHVTHEIPNTNGTSPSLSPDGGRIVYEDRDKRLFVVNRDGTGLRQLTPPGMRGSNAEWSPNGVEIVFDGNLPPPLSHSIWVIRADGTDLRRITDVPATRPSWSPDGGRIVYQRAKPRVWGDLAIINRDGTGEVIVADMVLQPYWGR